MERGDWKEDRGDRREEILERRDKKGDWIEWIGERRLERRDW